MKKIFVLMIVAAVAFCTGCNNKKHQVPTLKAPVEGADETDSTVYGVCGDGTSMHSLQLITDMGDTIEYMMIDADDNESEVAGGLMCGDRLAVVGKKTADGTIAEKVINIAHRTMDKHRQKLCHRRRRNRGVKHQSRNKTVDQLEDFQRQAVAQQRHV